jgi:hypothetical protein
MLAMATVDRNLSIVNQVYYMEVLKRLREKLDGNDPNFLPTTHGFCITTMHLLTWNCL